MEGAQINTTSLETKMQNGPFHLKEPFSQNVAAPLRQWLMTPSRVLS